MLIGDYSNIHNATERLDLQSDVAFNAKGSGRIGMRRIQDEERCRGREQNWLQVYYEQFSEIWRRGKEQEELAGM
jgi:hypothetical protein